MNFAKTFVFHFLAFLVSVALTIGALLLGLKFSTSICYLIVIRPWRMKTPTSRRCGRWNIILHRRPNSGLQARAREAALVDFYDDFDVASGDTVFSSTFVSNRRRRSKTTRYELC